MDDLSRCDLVFADPDTGIVDDADTRKGPAQFAKQMSLDEVRALVRGRCAVISHRNTRRADGHGKDVDRWMQEIAMPGLAGRAAAFSPRTFFVLNPDDPLEKRVRVLCQK